MATTPRRPLPSRSPLTSRWIIDPDIRRAETLPSAVYTDQALFEAGKDRVFARSWQLVGDEDSARTPGWARPVTLLPGHLDESLALVRDREDTLRCLSNVCTHRGYRVVEGAGACSTLRCRYHGRRFELDGSFRSMPEFEDAEDFPRPEDDLPRLPLEAWGPLLFTSLDPDHAFEEVMGPLAERLAWWQPGRMAPAPERNREYRVRCHWALYVENYLEGFHIPYVHPDLADALDYGSYRTELFDRSSLQLGIAQAGEDAFEPPEGTPDHGLEVAAYYWWLWPNTMVNVYPWGLSVNRVEPLAPDLTKVSFLTWVADPDRLDTGAGAALDRVEREDEAVVEAVQQGVGSRLYDRGRYSPKREQGVHHFHRLLAGALGS